MAKRNDLNPATRFAHMGRPKPGLGTPVNPPLDKASTLLFERAEDLYRSDVRGYGRHGSGVHDALAELFTALEGGVDTAFAPSGMAACSLAILAAVKAGDHILLTDNAYGPVRYFTETFLKRMGVTHTRFDPRIGAGISALIQDNTSLIWLESPGSLTFELHDIPAIVKAAKARGVATAIDNTWSGGISLKPLSLGVDMSVHSATKYYGGHSDLLMGCVISGSDRWAARVAKIRKELGYSTSVEDAYNVLRGFRSVHLRFEHSAASALHLAQWLETRDEVAQVLHPALPSHPDHSIWARDFTGGACLFGIVLNPVPEEKVLAFINALELFGIGYSYGGYESLVIHCDPQLNRKVTDGLGGPLVRFACGLEDAGDLRADIEQAFAALR